MNDESFENIDLDLFQVLNALDNKDYGYYDRLSDEQKKKFVPYLLLQWMSTLKNKGDIASYYLYSANFHANKHFLNELMQKHPKLQWLTLCAISPNTGKQLHAWIPQLSNKVALLREKASTKNVKDYFSKTNPNLSKNKIDELVKDYIAVQNKKVFFAEEYASMKFEDIETLSKIIDNEEISKYKEEAGY